MTGGDLSAPFPLDHIVIPPMRLRHVSTYVGEATRVYHATSQRCPHLRTSFGVLTTSAIFCRFLPLSARWRNCRAPPAAKWRWRCRAFWTTWWRLSTRRQRVRRGGQVAAAACIQCPPSQGRIGRGLGISGGRR